MTTDRLCISCSLAAERNYFKMKSMIIVAFALVAVSLALPVEEPVSILKSNYDQQPSGSYIFGFENSNGIKRNEEGTLKQVQDADNKPIDVVVVRGSYSYPSENGVETIEYTADENGFQAVGPSVPKAQS